MMLMMMMLMMMMLMMLLSLNLSIYTMTMMIHTNVTDTISSHGIEYYKNDDMLLLDV